MPVADATLRRLCTAACTNDTDLLAALLADGPVDINARSLASDAARHCTASRFLRQLEPEQQPLAWAIQAGAWQAAELLVASGASVDAFTDVRFVDDFICLLMTCSAYCSAC